MPGVVLVVPLVSSTTSAQLSSTRGLVLVPKVGLVLVPLRGTSSAKTALISSPVH